jgi:hypothetical protein
MSSLEIIVILTCLVESGLIAALLFRLRNPSPEENEYPHFTVRSKKFYRSQQGPDGTWEIE